MMMALRLAAVLLVLAACARGGPSGQAAQPSLVLELRAARDEPAASLSYDGRRVTAPPATYCWGQRCVDAFGFPPPGAGVTVPEGVTVELAGDATGAEVSLAEPGDGTAPQPPGATVQELRLRSGSDTLGVPPGDYWLVVFARWEGAAPSEVVGGTGDATFAFTLRVR